MRTIVSFPKSRDIEKIESGALTRYAAMDAQLQKLRQQHEAALKRYDFEKADLIHQQILRLRRTATVEPTGPTLPELDVDFQRNTITACSAQADQLRSQKESELETRFLVRQQAIEAHYTEESNKLCLKHTLNTERVISKPTPQVQVLLAEATMNGRVHNYSRAQELYREAKRLQALFSERRSAELDAAFRETKQRLEARKARDLELLNVQRESARLELIRQYDEAQRVMSNMLNVKDSRASRQRRIAGNPNHSLGCDVTVSTPRRARNTSHPRRAGSSLH
jgi:hypothetical protein